MNFVSSDLLDAFKSIVLKKKATSFFFSELLWAGFLIASSDTNTTELQ